MPNSRPDLFRKAGAVFLCLTFLVTAGIFPGCDVMAEANHPTQSASAPQESTPIPTTTPEPSPTITPTPTPTPDPNDQYFSDTEKVETGGGHWNYSSPTLSVQITKYTDKKIPLVYYVAHIRVRGEEKMMPGFGGGKPPGSAQLPAAIARKYKAVYAQNGDYFADTRNPAGVVIRNGKVYRNRKAADTLAVMPDGTLKVYLAGEVKAAGLLALGVKNSYSFGPGLIQNGVIRPKLSKCRLNIRNPRSGIGMAEKGHYVAIVVEGRTRTSRGVTFNEYAKLFADQGCTEAYNFDGGASSCMVFMGKAINKSTDRLTTGTFRRVPDIIIFGRSDAVK